MSYTTRSAIATFTVSSSHTENYPHVLTDSLGTFRDKVKVAVTSSEVFRPLTQIPPKIITIEGTLPGGRWLTRPITIVIEYDDGEFVVSEPEFHMHASASTEREAISAFRRIFSGYLDVLAAREKTLGPQLRDQLDYLRSAIASE
jgi:hypothetical protein